MSWQNEVNELNRKKELARQMGGPEKVAQQHAKERLTARERVDCILDKESFREIGTLAGQAEYDETGDLKSFVPSSIITGYGQINYKTVCIMANDFTVKGGSSDSNAIMKQEYIERMALERLMPLVCLYEGGGGRVTEGGGGAHHYANKLWVGCFN
ncbi:carboxyl transferase domain-containing protein [Chloroflexota bacterium]